MEIIKMLGGTILVNLVIWGIGIGVYKNKVNTLEKNLADFKREHDNDINKVVANQNSMGKVLDTISISVARLDAKMDLLMTGKINIFKEE